MCMHNFSTIRIRGLSQIVPLRMLKPWDKMVHFLMQKEQWVRSCRLKDNIKL
jgi:hypothetical protein